MPLTPEQVRIKRLFEGDPLANRQLPQEQAAPNYSPQDYQTPESSPRSPGLSYLNPAYKPGGDHYQDAIANRFAQITKMGQGPTEAALSARRAQLQAESAARASANTGGGGGGGSYNYDAGSGLTGNAERDKIMRLVAAQKGMPYSWGGGNSKGPSYGLSGGGERHGSSRIYGFDCSGLVQYAYAQIGIKMPRLGNQQLARGTRISMGQAKPGDLVGKPGHIAIYAGNGMMWEAPTFGKSVRYVPVRKGMFAVRVQGVG